MNTSTGNPASPRACGQGYPRPRWQVHRHAPPFGIVAGPFNARLSFPADLPERERERLIHVATAFAHVLRTPSAMARLHGFDAWAAAIARQFDLHHPKVCSACLRLRRIHAACCAAQRAEIAGADPFIEHPGKEQP